MKFEYTIQEVNTEDIVVDELGQRDVNRRQAQFKKIMETFDPNLVQDISVALIDGVYYCFDGQMTRKVLIAQNDGHHLPVRCKVYKGMTKADAAMMFVKQRGITSPVDVTDKLRVLANYDDKEAMAFINLTEENGLSISWTRNRSKGAVVAVGTLFKIYQAYQDKEDYAALVRIISNSWGGDTESTRQQILRGLDHFLKCYKGLYSESILTTKLSEVSPKEIIRNAEIDRTMGSRKYAVQILQIYNQRMHEKNRLPNLL